MSLMRRFLKVFASRPARRVVAVILGCVLILGLWALWWEPSSLRTVRRTVPIQGWHAAHSGLRVAVLSDLHVGAPHRSLSNLRQVVAATNAEKPDLIVLLGDFVIQG